MKYKGLFGNKIDPHIEDYQGSLLDLKKIAKDAATWHVDYEIEMGCTLDYVEDVEVDVVAEIMDYLDYMNIKCRGTWADILNNDDELLDCYLEGRRERIFSIKQERRCVSDIWPLIKKKKYCVEFNYNCCSHYTVDAFDEEEAIKKASELDKQLTKEEWYDNLDIECDETQVREED